jgi:hypothetical protein
LRRTLIILVLVIAVMAVLAYGMQSFDLMGMLIRAHSPPAH